MAIRGVTVYNSADYATSFTAVTSIKIGEHYTFDNVKVQTDSYNKSKEAVYAGSSAILELNKSVTVTSVTITFDVDQPISICEVKILGELSK